MNKIVTVISTYKKEIGGLLRHAATIAGGVLIAKGSLTTDTFTNQKSQPHNTTGSYLVYTDTSNNGQKVEENSFISLSNFNAGDGDIIGFALD